MSERIKPLSFREAERCENAREPACKCRCGGAKHGAKRGTGEQLGFRSFYEALPDEDPHHIPSDKERKELGALRSMRASLSRAKARWPAAWTQKDEIHLSTVEKQIIRLEKVVLGIQHKEHASV